MSSDDQHVLHVLTEYSKHVGHWTGSLWDASDRHFASVAGYVKRQVPESWLPVRARPLPPPAPPPPLLANMAYLQRAHKWVSEHRALTAAMVAFAGTGGLLLWREKRSYNRKRRAPRASNGARRDVVVLGGPPNAPITKSLSLDLERRGFIVYQICSTMDEEQQVLGEARADLRPLHLDVVDSFGMHGAMERFHDTLRRHNLTLRAVVLVPDVLFPTGPVETVSPELWSDALNAKVLNTIAVTQALLPTICASKARLLMLTPSIAASLRPPFHAVETTVVKALEGFLASLRAELRTLGIHVLHFRLGTFDYSHAGAKQQQLQTRAAGSPHAWPATTRALYARNFETHLRAGLRRGLLSGDRAGSSLRELHKAVFDAITQRRPRTVWRIGRGSVAYGVVGRWLPEGLVGWMLGVRRVSLAARSRAELEDSVQAWEKVEALPVEALPD
ncbi:hypothetical protein ACEQ8H_000810 [Pleosporales sp. CAS-2024a]